MSELVDRMIELCGSEKEGKIIITIAKTSSIVSSEPELSNAFKTHDSTIFIFFTFVDFFIVSHSFTTTKYISSEKEDKAVTEQPATP